MRKKSILILIAVMCTVFVLTGCKSEFGMQMQDDGKGFTVNALRASEGDFTTAGVLIVGENEKLSVEQNFEGDGSVLVSITPSDTMDIGADADPDEIQDAVNAGESALDFSLTGTEPAEYGLDPGEYYVTLTVESKTTGEATISVVAM